MLKRTLKVLIVAAVFGTLLAAAGRSAPAFPCVSQFLDWDNRRARRPLLLAQASDPADTWLIGDAGWADLGMAEPVFRHLDATNCAYLDGHAETLRTLDLDGGGPYYEGVSTLNDARLLFTR